MSVISRRPEADPLYAGPLPQRAAYATGMLLDAQDFVDEQTYHRGRLARALAFLAGGGTLAGLEVTHRPASAEHAEEIQVSPGIAVDRIGRLVEIPRPACLRLERWFAGETERDGGDTLRRAALGGLDRFIGARAQALGALPARAVVADIYLRFVACENGLTPSFAAGPFDALDAVSASRLRDAYELHLIAGRLASTTISTAFPTPDPIWPRSSISTRAAPLQDAILRPIRCGRRHRRSDRTAAGPSTGARSDRRVSCPRAGPGRTADPRNASMKACGSTISAVASSRPRRCWPAGSAPEAATRHGRQCKRGAFDDRLHRRRRARAIAPEDVEALRATGALVEDARRERPRYFDGRFLARAT
jgi:hypothetical protein